MLLNQQYKDKPLDCHVSVFFNFYFLTPTSWRKSQREAALCHQPAFYPPGDIDNLIKSIADAMTQAKVWEDDRLLVTVTASKAYSTREGVMVVVVPLQ